MKRGRRHRPSDSLDESIPHDGMANRKHQRAAKRTSQRRRLEQDRRWAKRLEVGFGMLSEAGDLD